MVSLIQLHIFYTEIFHYTFTQELHTIIQIIVFFYIYYPHRNADRIVAYFLEPFPSPENYFHLFSLSTFSDQFISLKRKK